MTVERLRAGELPDSASKDELWSYLTEIVWKYYNSDVEYLWKRLYELGNHYHDRSTFPHYCLNTRQNSMIYHGRARDVFRELLPDATTFRKGFNKGFRLNLALYLNEECSALDLWEVLGGSVDKFSKKNFPEFCSVLEEVSRASLSKHQRLIDLFRDSIGRKNFKGPNEVYFGIRLWSEDGWTTQSGQSSNVEFRVVEFSKELPHKLPFEILHFNDLSESFRGWFSSCLRDSANELRTKKGVPKIGEGWVSETALFQKIKSSFPELEVLQHGRPRWLGRQHFDIWIPAAKVAVEYHGAQHFRPIEFFGGEKTFKETQERDKKKIAVAKKNGVSVLVVTEEMSGVEIEELVYKSITKRLR